MEKSGSPIVIECFALRLLEPECGGSEHRLVGRHVQGPCETHPDIDAARLVGLVGTHLDGTALLHSTSWRWDADVGLIVTYLCCPDPQPALTAPLVPAAGRHTSADDNPSRPHHRDVGLADILHHGVDHLAWLGDHHPLLVAGVRDLAPAIHRAIQLAGRHRSIQFIGARPDAAIDPAHHLEPHDVVLPGTVDERAAS